MNYDKKYMARCLELAKNGTGTARPNPSVGAVIVHNDKIIGEGFTDSYGGPHAEVNAVNSVKDESLLKEATIYVTLEPCSHHGKTPPCADLIVRKQIPNVVIGTVDTNSLVFGEGIKRLKKAGCNVKVGVLEEECKQHHKRFFTVQNKQRPYIILKWAETSNGFIAPKNKEKQEPVWISNTYAKQLVHKWRSEEHAILVGTNTVLADNPKLNVRSWSGNNPTRIVLDKSLRIPNDSSVIDGSIPTIILTEKEEGTKENIIFERIDFSKELAFQICGVLSKHKIQSVIIEGGTQTLQSFIDDNLWDEARVFIGDVSFSEGIKAPVLNSFLSKQETIKNNTLKYFFND
ncbi:bifunctional diaminohydroxyphosphoribosylaminopyrimidine deaminase/5-amino-6-(5-phosphoribosylamino)uracil reductase RibD [Tenacibaculum sp. ZS6-P6]|uniref:bifunctional diaminohydroxyphosphoribosylaminopyrimidine deaminase/5-amino-6-(5-phosphoribosylamino)uracil reductase RibD n=1 Tax=Tenacibaculum sp. ZS6-P6 TaxID=3447503 RepID=UPI003F9C1B69